MTFASKENIPVMTTAMNSNNTSSLSSNAPESAAATDVAMKEEMDAKDAVETTEGTTEETSVQQQTTGCTTDIESSVSKKRLNTETLDTTNSSTDHEVVDDDTGDMNDESPTTTSAFPDAAREKVHQQQSQQLERDDDDEVASRPTANDGIHDDDRTLSQVVVVVGTPIDLQRPVKRARTAYFLFLDDFRSTVQKENPGVSVATIARILGQRWSAMSDDDKQPYQARALIERERVTAATEAWKKAAVAAGKNIQNVVDNNKQQNTNENGVASIVLPVGRVRKICRLDPDVRGISKEALLLITKVTEMATIQLGQECVKTAHIQNRRTLLPQDIVDVCNVRESFFFLKDDITDLHRQQQKNVKAKSSLQNGTNAAHPRKGPDTTMTTSKSLTDYFKPVA